jgi:transcriptional regulator with XRE-family HTH domain
MARRLGIQPARYSHYETGKRRFPIMIIRAASAVLGCTLDDLIRPAFSLPARDSAPESFPAH